MNIRFATVLLVAYTFALNPPSSMSQKVDEDGAQLIEAPFTYSPPTIDGVIHENEWSGAESNTVDFVDLGVAGNGGSQEIDGPDDFSYTFSVMYDDTFLYIAVDVTDDVYISTNYGQRLQWDMPVTWLNDSVEYFFDGDMNRTIESSRNPTESETGGQWIFGAEADDSPLPFVTAELMGGLSRPYGTGADAVWYAQTTADETTGNWQQEARFQLDIIGSPSAGSSIGFNIGLDDADSFDELTLDEGYYDDNNRDIQLYWTVFSYSAGEFSQESAHEIEDLWGTMRFLEPASIGGWSIY